MRDHPRVDGRRAPARRSSPLLEVRPRLVLPCAVLSLSLLSMGRAVAAPEGVIEGTIVQIERGTAYLDVGEQRGLRPGVVLAVLRTVTAQHPVTHAPLVDHFPIGTLRVEEVGQVLSFGRVDKRIVGLVKVGDTVRGEPAEEVPAPPPVPVVTRPSQRAPEAARGGDPEAEAATRLWQSTLGKPLPDRIHRIEAWLSFNARSPYAAAMEQELSTLRMIDGVMAQARAALDEARAAQAALAAEEDEPEADRKLRLEVLGQMPTRLYQGDPLGFAILVTAPDQVAAAFAYVRRSHEESYTRLPMARSGDGYFRALAPAQVVAPPGVRAFVEIVDGQGHKLTAGSADNPRKIDVIGLPVAGQSGEAGHSDVRGFFEFVDWNRLRGNDYHVVAEGDVSYRLGTWLHAVRLGFGVLYGRGGAVADLDKNDLRSGLVPCNPEATPADLTCGHEVGFNYGFVETELRFGKWAGAVARLSGGQTVHGPGIGAELRLRIGDSTGTNLQLGGAVLKDIGALGLLQLEWNVIQGWPMSAAVVVTNQPTQDDIGVRIVYQVAYRVRPWLQPAVRIGYDARNIQHGGPSFGLGLLGSW